MRTAFAFGRLARVNVFHHSPGNSVTLEHPFRIYATKPCGRAGPGWFSYAMLFRTSLATCIEHAGLVMVNGPPNRTNDPE